MSHKKTIRLTVLGALAIGGLVLAGCSSANPLGDDSTTSSSSGAASDKIVIGSQAYYSNEIIAEIYAQALEAKGMKVDRQFNIGQRDAYMPALESGQVTLFPEYTGNLLQWFDKSATQTDATEVYDALVKVLPTGLSALDQASAADQDSYTVTQEFATAHSLKTISDLANVPNLTLGGAPELQDRPYGPKGLKEVYGVDVQFSPTADTTLDELLASTIQVADIYTADPSIQTKKLVTLEDPKHLFLASHVVPIVNDSIKDKVADTINAVSAKLTTEDLVAMNVESTQDKKSATDIAKEWLAKAGLS